ncbi:MULTISPECIES: alpha/beta hydrolase [unclassified Crossiella]|uniref:alpha/beta hydrolase n=1 Tax=unclassified Crossiella TaxID=2620835 RepID=UPI001FFF31D0|nr:MULTISPECIES: alpha/beta hydrolase [unclassified Crossiella]MCK2237687.1 alpha/beta hydrolase [Crossiella sp. S99.2]MCK2254973.1 alpha/beta hydrolase [Crossiella sp. S99.1]
MSVKADTVVLIHGLWMTPKSWDGWVQRFTEQGYRVLTPGWPGVSTPEATNADPSALNGLGITEIVDHYAKIIEELDTPPILMGHSFGGLVVQLLLDRGLGAAGVAIHAGAPKGVLRLPPATLRTAWPVLKNPANLRRSVPLNEKQFRYSFGNVLTAEQSRAAWLREAIPGPGRPFFQAALANLNPRAVTKVDFRNPDRAPLLIVAGGKDHVVTAGFAKANYRLQQRNPNTTEFLAYPERGHLTAAEPGWEQVADTLLAWAEANQRVLQP